MKKIIVSSALLLVLQASFAFADIVVEDGYVRGLPPGVANTAAYMSLRNTGTTDMVLTGATTPIAEQVTLHSTMDHGGMLHMEPLQTMTVPAGGELLLQSGGMHLMLEELRGSPMPGTDVELTLEFADGSLHVLTLPVKSVLDE